MNYHLSDYILIILAILNFFAAFRAIFTNNSFLWILNAAACAFCCCAIFSKSNY